MEKIPLRAYNREIEHLIDNDRSQDALDQCQLVLDQYPRCLDTLRLMGKAYLELRQFDKAEDIFQKVLACVPDDFTANLGMSLLREKQTNLEGTIWHMERAYEAQPSNTAVQNELRRLYKQRDGIDSPRIRLTRGALVRMYMRGDLVPQAINEIQSILNEDPSRMDIRILQALATMKAGRKDEALNLCQEILAELPFCYDANRLLFENRSASIKIEEAQIIQQRLRELDPYFEFTSQDQPDPAKVPEEEVKLEIAVGSGPKTATGISSQNQSLPALGVFNQSSTFSGSGVLDRPSNQQSNPEEAFKSEEKIPSWMGDLQAPIFQNQEESSNTGSTTGGMSVTSNKEFQSGKPMTTDDSHLQNEYPNDKGDFPFSGSEESQTPANPFLAVPGDAIPNAEPGDIPEWLRALASEPPAASSDAVTSPLRVPGETGVLQTGEENLDFLRNFSGEGNETQKSEEPPSIHPANSVQSLSDILPPSPFLTSNETTQPVPLEEGGEIAQPPSKDMPDWLRSAVEPSVVEPIIQPSAEQSAAVDFRQDFTSESLPPVESREESVAIENQFQAPEPEELATAPVSEDELPTPEIEQYLEQLRKDISPGDQPEWLKKENLGNELEALFEENKPSVKPIEPESSPPDWMAQLKQEEVTPPPQKTTPQPPASVPNVPDWLFTPEETDGETAPIQSDSPITHQPPPDWLAAARPDIFSQDFEQQDVAQSQATIPETPNEEAAIPEQVDFSASLVQPVSPEPVSKEPEHPEIELPDLGFLKSEPLDFMAVSREPLEDNLESSTLPLDEKEELDFSQAIPAESLPADLAALLREEEVSEITTNPLQPEPVPGSSFDLNISELNREESRMDFQPETPELENIQEEEFPLSEKLEIPEIFSTSTDFSTEALQSEINAQLDGLFNHKEQPVETVPTPPEDVIPLEVEKPEMIQPAVEIFSETEQPLQSEVSSLPPEKVVEFEQAEEIIQKEPEPSIEQNKTVPVIPIVPAPQFEAVVPEKNILVEKAFVETSTPQPEPVFVVEEKPVAPKSKTVRPVRPPSTPKAVRYVEKPVQVSTASQRKNAGAADLARAREAASHGDIQTALRRYIRLVNSNKALEFVSNDLKELVRKNPKNYLAWQTFGDARLRSNRIQEALDAYAKAAELLK